MASLSHEEENYIRLSLLLTGITPRAVRSLFDREFAPQVLQGTLRKAYSKLLALYNRRILNQTQWKVLASKQDSRNFDISLMICLLTNVAQIPGYERLPLPTDTSEGADLARIKHHRNYLAHLNDCRVDNSYFNTAWSEMVDVIRRLSDSGTLQECMDLRTQVLDRSNLEIVSEIKRSQDEINNLKQTVRDHETVKYRIIEVLFLILIILSTITGEPKRASLLLETIFKLSETRHLFLFLSVIALYFSLNIQIKK